EARIDLGSINTNNEQRDAHLLNADFFDMEQHPEMIFKSTGVKAINNDAFELTGDLTIKGITRPVKLAVDYNGLAKDPWGGERAGFTVTGKINRADWGVSFNGVMETGGLMLGEEVKISADIQLIKEAAAVAA